VSPDLRLTPPLPPLTVFRSRGPEPAFPLAEANCRLYARGRQGLYHGLRELGVSSGDEVLTPAYHHGSEVEAISRAGAVARFYGGTPELEPSEPELGAMVGPRTRALHLIHHLGFPQDSARWRAWCDERGLILVEDAAAAWLSRSGDQPVGSFGDLANFSLYKTVGLSDGGAVLCRQPLPVPDGSRGSGLRQAVRGQAARVAERIPVMAAFAHRPRSNARFDAGAEFGLGDPSARCSYVTEFLLRRFRTARVPDLRRANYRVLLERLTEHAPPPFDRLPEGSCPWFFPVRASDKVGMISHLAARGIRAGDFWPQAHPTLPVDRFADARRRRATTVALPVHHGLRVHDLERIAAAALDWYRWHGGA
jgi:dTDP-4-amino-4,6-dideoxygalactose transaminase